MKDFLTSKDKEDLGWTIKEYHLPVPVHASPTFVQYFKKLGVPNDQLNQLIPPSKAAWNKHMRAIDLLAVDGIQKQILALNIQLETINLAGVTVRKLLPPSLDPHFENALFVHVHGGAFVLNAGINSISEGLVIAAYLKMPVWSIDYRMPPDDPFPAALDDVVNVYKEIIRLYPDKKIVMGGSSAGGQLVMAAILQLKSEQIKLPAALHLSTPWSDLTKTGDSYYTNENIDQTVVTYEGFLEASAKLYANGEDLKAPLLSPIYGDLSDFPPSQLVSGSRDLFLSNTIRTHRKLRDAGSEADLVVLEGFSHAQHVFFYNTPEAIAVYNDLRQFLKKYM